MRRKIEGIGIGRARYRFLRWRVGRALDRRIFMGRSRIPAQRIDLEDGFCVQLDLEHEITIKRVDRQKNALRKKTSRTRRRQRQLLRKSDEIDIQTGRKIAEEKTIKLSDEDRKRLVELYRTAQTTPMIALTSKDALDGRDLATLAWDDVRTFMDSLGEKYGFNPVISAIDPETGIVSKRLKEEVKKGMKTKVKCQIVGCEKDAEYICRPGMCSGMYCRKHFDEIYYGKD